MQCYKHPKEETALSCGKCDRPICTRCMVSAPAGWRCPECASLRSTALYKIAPHRIFFALIAGLVTGIIGAFVMRQCSWFVFFIGPIYGGIVAEAVLRAAGRKRGPILEVIGVGSIVLGGILMVLPELVVLLNIGRISEAAREAIGYGAGFLGLIWPLIGICLGASTCYYRLKYL